MWAVTITHEIDMSAAAMDAAEDQLAAFDGSVGRRPRVLYGDEAFVTDVTVFVAESDPATALQHGVDLAQSAVGDHRIIATEVVDEELYVQRAAAPTLPSLLSAPEVGDLLNVSRQRVHQLRASPQFPAPLYELRTGAVWAASAIEAFARTWNRKSGPRRSASST